MDEDLESRINALVNLVKADVSSRVVREVMADLSPAERNELKALILKRVKEKIPELVDAKIDTLVKGWVQTEANDAASKVWVKTKTTIAEKVGAKIRDTVSEGSLAPLVDEFVKPELRSFVLTEIRKVLQSVRATR